MQDVTRRLFLRGGVAAACSAAAHPLLTTVTFAQGAAQLGENRLIVVILRGAMDGLDAVQPIGDPLFARMRPKLGTGAGVLPLDGLFGLHPAMAGLMPLWTSGELAFVHATSTPYRDKRSHFDGQDILEAGTGLDVPVPEVRDGWLNRMLQAVPGIASETAYAVGREAQPLLAGAAEIRSWTPEVTLSLSAQSRLLLEQVYHDDALFRDAGGEAMDLAAELAGGAAPASMEGGGKFADTDRLAGFAADRLKGDTRIAAFSLSGWDTHRRQEGALPQQLRGLERLILVLREQMGSAWDRTMLLAMTEFGRTVAENGSAGTDHGTGGAMLMAGGALKGGRIYGRWPGLAEEALYERRDLMPTSDVRGWAAWAMRGLYGLDRRVLEQAVFPGLDMGDDPGFLR
ncbi:DUF1501 domain-containing protein [Gemmobacter sp. LW-1]|uniref:DUF1501 domain-containing protein n=1 Tax=Gemmobacter sp. LW-1 TaxID=1529005 RepID=UPI0006C7683D|nr:DUF1501 domain-containing protein [Gemmobacter sp. LW-1]